MNVVVLHGRSGFVAIALSGVVAALLVGCNSSRGWDPGTDRYSVCDVVQQAVTDRLKSPGTAKFQDCKAMTVTNDGSEAGVWKLAGYVDSQNGFGGVVRSDFTATAQSRARPRDDSTGLRGSSPSNSASSGD